MSTDSAPVAAYHENPVERAVRVFVRHRPLILLLVAYVIVRLLVQYWRRISRANGVVTVHLLDRYPRVTLSSTLLACKNLFSAQSLARCSADWTD